MRMLTMTRDMRPYQAGHDYLFPDPAAKQLIDSGEATPAKAEKATKLAPDPVPAPAPPPTPPARNRYITRRIPGG